MKSLCVKRVSVDEVHDVNRFYKEHGEKSRVKKNETAFIAELGGAEGNLTDGITGDVAIVAALRILPLIKNGAVGQEKSFWWLRSIFVAEPFRHRGIASKLLAAVVKECDGECYCFPFPPLQPLYESVGFEIYRLDLLPAELRGRFQRYQRKNDILAMAWSQKVRAC